MINAPLIGLFVSAITPTACGGPTSPTVPGTGETFTGIWQGQYRITECAGDRHCGAFIGGLRSFVLRLQQTGGSVTGVVVLVHEPVDNAYYQGDLTVNVTGDVAPDGGVTVRGRKPALSPSDASGDVDVESFTLKPSTSETTGMLAYVSRYVPLQNPETSLKRVAGIIVNATRATSMPVDVTAPFQGHWSGRIVMRTCTEPELLLCRTGADAFRSFDLTLMQSASMVSGTLDQLPVTGTVSGQTLTVQGSSAPLQVGGGFVVTRVVNWSTTIDNLGRMQGLYTYVYDFNATSGVNAGKVFTTTIVYDLVSVVLVP